MTRTRYTALLVALAAGCSASATGAPAGPGDGRGGPDASVDAASGGGEAGGSLPSADGAPLESGSPRDAGVGADGAPAGADGAPPVGGAMTVGVDVHNYPKPSAYGYLAADGKDRMGASLAALGVTAVRGATVGDTTFLARLAAFGVKEVVLGLSASAHGMPFDPANVAPALQKSLTAAQAAGITVQVEGLNEWDLFNSKAYNAGVLPAGMTNTQFVLYTQKALYEAAHPLGLTVLGPSVGHPGDPTSLALFPDVSAYVDVVNAHIYFTSSPETLPLATLVSAHERFEGSGKPFWVTETGISSYGSVTTAAQADVIGRGIATFAASGLIDRMYDYELLDDQQPGLNGSTYIPDSAEYHFGLYTFAGDPKPAAMPVQTYIAGH